MPINVKISMCKVTAASKLFQRHNYLPLLQPLSPKDALRRKIITGQNVLGNRIEHYIPVLECQEDRFRIRRSRKKGQPVIKKRVRMNTEKNKYVTPIFDDEMENHSMLKNMMARKSKGKGQMYIYEVLDKQCILVISHQMERAIRDKDITDVIMALRSDKIVCKLKNGYKVNVPLGSYEGNSKLYRGSGWTREFVEDDHHHGRDTFQLAQIFEAKEQGVEEWELEMMRLANKRKKKARLGAPVDATATVQDSYEMDWEDEDEEEAKQVPDEEEQEAGEEENASMEVNDMEKTKNVAEKLKAAGEKIILQLPSVNEVPEVIKNLESGELCELANVSGVRLKLADGKQCFVAGQTVNQDDEEVFVPGQTITKEDGTSEYTPGVTVNVNNEPTLLPGLVTGEETTPPVFLPGESTITEQGQLQFEAKQEDTGILRRPRPVDSRSSSSSPERVVKPKPKKPEEPIVIRRRNFDEDPQPLIKERVKKRPPLVPARAPSPPHRVELHLQSKPMEEVLREAEEQRQLKEEAERKNKEDERKKLKARELERQLQEEKNIDKLRLQIRLKMKNMKFEAPPPYKPVEPVRKSQKLEEYEESILKGTFFEDEQTKKILDAAKSSTRTSKFESIGIGCGRNQRVY